eukprot:jgi/Botrbrau1/22804/Bobra.0132s0129.1
MTALQTPRHARTQHQTRSVLGAYQQDTLLSVPIFFSLFGGNNLKRCAGIPQVLSNAIGRHGRFWKRGKMHR